MKIFVHCANLWFIVFAKEVYEILIEKIDSVYGFIYCWNFRGILFVS